LNFIMMKWFLRKRPAPVEAVRDFVDTIEFINVLLAKELAEQEARLGSARAVDAARLAGRTRLGA
jgi:hypothetical protein